MSYCAYMSYNLRRKRSLSSRLTENTGNHTVAMGIRELAPVRMIGASRERVPRLWRAAPAAVVAALAILSTPPARATDPEGCLTCHQYRGLSHLEAQTGELRLFFCSMEYYTYRLGPHARLRCTDCHVRDEVAVFPHSVRTPVDCARLCHVSSPESVEIRFSHAGVRDTLERSAHSSKNLANLPFDPPLPRPGQSTCLYCHDEPVFRWPMDEARIGAEEAAFGRCQTCHEKEFPIDVEYFTRHMSSRLQPERPARQLAQVCAVCHSDEVYVAQSNGHDPVASYLHSFHGKAKLLGSKETAVCVDCHDGEQGGSHAMLGAKDPRSAIHPANVSDTCRSIRCHPGASPRMSSAAVHLRLDPSARTVEFYVAAFFIALTAGVMVVFFLLLVLDLFSMIVRRADPEAHRLACLARRLYGDPRARKLLERLTVHQRVQHWLLAITFGILVYTGMCLRFADEPWAAYLVSLIGGLSFARNLHRICGVVMLVGFAYHILYLLFTIVRRKRAARREGRRVGLKDLVFESPMMITLEDVKEFFRLWGSLLFLRSKRPKFRRYNFLQKFDYWAVFWGCIVIGASGALLWGGEWASEYVSGRAMNFAFIIHSYEAYLAFIHIAVVHLFAVIFSPGVFPLSGGSLGGLNTVRDLAEWNGREVERAAAELRIEAEPEPHKRRGFWWSIGQSIRRLYAAALVVAIVLVAVACLRYLVGSLLSTKRAPTEIVAIPTRLTAETLRSTPHASGKETGVEEHLTRGPLAHFHHIPPWFQPDPGNRCSASGCHAPLPHGRRVETRAFLNMHASFLDCGVCHSGPVERTPRIAWYDLRSGGKIDSPAVLRLASFLEGLDASDEGQAEAINQRLTTLLREALEAAGRNAQLRAWLTHLETTSPRSKLWRRIVENLRQDIPMHMHGEYNAKIATYDSGGRALEPGDAQKAATAAYLAEKETLSASRRETLLGEIHRGVEKKGHLCAPCHGAGAAFVDFSSLGYPPSRVAMLRASAIARLILQVESGQPFHVPRLLEGSDEKK